MGSRVGNSVEIIVYICTARGMEVRSCEDADNNIVMRRRTQQPGIHWPSDYSLKRRLSECSRRFHNHGEGPY